MQLLSTLKKLIISNNKGAKRQRNLPNRIPEQRKGNTNRDRSYVVRTRSTDLLTHAWDKQSATSFASRRVWTMEQELSLVFKFSTSTMNLLNLHGVVSGFEIYFTVLIESL